MMAKLLNPDIYRPVDVPDTMKPHVRRALVADTVDMVDIRADVRGTGYHYFGWVWRGCWQGIAGGATLFSTDIDGPFSLSGQVIDSEVTATMQGDMAQIFLEFTALGHFQLLGLTGEQMLENACAPDLLNPQLRPYFKMLTDTKENSVKARMALLADVFSQLPRHAVPDGIVAAITRIEAVDGDIRLADLVEELGLSERQFRTEFKALVGLPPKSFCNTLRINLALNQLLKHNAGDLADIAAQTGFSDQAHFTRAFSDYLGNAPRRYIGDIETTLARFMGQSRQ